MYDPFNDYFGLSGLLSNCRMDDMNNSTQFHSNDDFNSNGVNVPVISSPSTVSSSISDLNNNVVSGLPASPTSTTASTGFMPLNVLNMADITELSKVMRGGRRGNGRGAGPGGRPPIVSWCVFCKNNGESEMVYASHKLKSEEGLTTCPILRAYTCPLCGTNGDHAHTIKYCPINKVKENVGVGSTSGPGTIGMIGSQYRTPRTSTGRRRTSSLSLSSGGTYIGGHVA